MALEGWQDKAVLLSLLYVCTGKAGGPSGLEFCSGGSVLLLLRCAALRVCLSCSTAVNTQGPDTGETALKGGMAIKVSEF